MRLLAAILLSTLLVSTAFAEPGVPADTKQLAKRIGQLAAPRDEPVPARILAAKKVASEIGDWIVRTLERDPSTSADKLEMQLTSMLGQGLDGGTPKVFAQGWGPAAKTRQVVIAYVLYLGFMGPGSSLVRIESFVWEKESGKAHSTVQGGAALNGRAVTFQQITEYADRQEYWIIASGPPIGWSGSTFHGRAILYRVNSGEIQPIWDRSLSDLRVQKNELGWEANYADSERFYDNKPHPYVFDVYSLDWQDRTFHRVIHYRY